MRIVVNGRDRDLPDGPLTLEGLRASMDLAPGGLVCEWNGRVVPREAWGAQGLGPGDRVEWVRFVGGG